jgi:phosphatidylglycerophosphatase A
MNKVSRLIATLFYIGYCPIAPGTAGSFAAMILYLFLPVSIVAHQYFWLVVLLFIPISFYFTGRAEKRMERDDKRIILDELIGYFVSILFLPRSLAIAVIAFALFRLFDIFKPEPIKSIQDLKGGLGIVMDDVLAGVYSNLILQTGYFVYKIYFFSPTV